MAMHQAGRVIYIVPVHLLAYTLRHRLAELDAMMGAARELLTRQATVLQMNARRKILRQASRKIASSPLVTPPYLRMLPQILPQIPSWSASPSPPKEPPATPTLLHAHTHAHAHAHTDAPIHPTAGHHQHQGGEQAG